MIFASGWMGKEQIINVMGLAQASDLQALTIEVRRELSRIFVPTIIDRAVAKTAYESAKQLREKSIAARIKDDIPETEEAEAAAEKSVLDAEIAYEAAEIAHEAFIEAEG